MQITYDPSTLPAGVRSDILTVNLKLAFNSAAAPTKIYTFDIKVHDCVSYQPETKWVVLAVVTHPTLSIDKTFTDFAVDLSISQKCLSTGSAESFNFGTAPAEL